MRPFEQRQEDALRVPITMVSVSMLAIGVALLAMLAFAVVMLNSEGATKAPGRAILGYTLPLCALIVIAITFHVRRLLSALEIAQRELCERKRTPVSWQRTMLFRGCPIAASSRRRCVTGWLSLPAYAWC